MATQVCNLSCAGCTNYSDLQHKDYVKWDTIEHDILSWLEIIDIQEFGIIGGEPLINPRIVDWIIGIRKILPNTTIRFTTNGLLLHKNLNIIKLMHELGNFTFKITLHKTTPTLNQIVKNIFNDYEWETVFEYGVQRYKTRNNFRFQLNTPTVFTKSFIGEYDDMKPYNSDIHDAFSNCCQQTCPLLHNGKIYKCSTSGLLQDTLKLHNSPNKSLWGDISDYEYGISPTSSMSDISKFVDNFGKANDICKQCPSITDMDSFLDHNKTTVFK